MKKTAIFSLLASGMALSAHAAVFSFDLTPGGLLGSNERPTPNSSTASGNELSVNFPEEPGIYYNNVTKQIFLNYGWGSAHGFTDLNGDTYSAMHIHGSATSTSETAAGVLYNLASVASIDGKSGGVFRQFVQLVDNPNNTGYTIAQQEQQLMEGRWYINIHSTPQFGPGEIRGQLTPVPEPETYAMMAGLGLLGFAAYRRYQAKAA